MSKKLDVDRHTGPGLALVCFLAILIFVVWMVVAVLPVVVTVSLTGMCLFFSSPYWVAYLWNKFIATEEGYYD